MAEWRLTFWIVFGVLLATNTVYVLLARADIQPWDRPELDAPGYPLGYSQGYPQGYSEGYPPPAEGRRA